MFIYIAVLGAGIILVAIAVIISNILNSIFIKISELVVSSDLNPIILANKAVKATAAIAKIFIAAFYKLI